MLYASFTSKQACSAWKIMVSFGRWKGLQIGDWSSLMVLIHRMNGDIRLCTDFGALNMWKVSGFNCQPSKRWRAREMDPGFFSVLDYRSGYWQTPVAESLQLSMTFSLPFGRYCYQPFGSVSVPGVFRRVVSQLLGNIQGACCYLADMLIFAKPFPEHNAMLDQVLTQLQQAGIKMPAAKCSFE